MSNVPPKLTLPPLLYDAQAMRRYAQTPEGRERLRTLADELEQAAAVEEHNLKVGREGIRLLRDALGDLEA